VDKAREDTLHRSFDSLTPFSSVYLPYPSGGPIDRLRMGPDMGDGALPGGASRGQGYRRRHGPGVAQAGGEAAQTPGRRTRGALLCAHDLLLAMRRTGLPPDDQHHPQQRQAIAQLLSDTDGL
jgi:hypothetical protein